MFVMTVSFSSCMLPVYSKIVTLENDGIELFTTKLPERSYVEVAYIQTGGSTLNSPQRLLNELMKKVAEQNADAVIDVKYHYLFGSTVVSGTAIRCTDQE